MIYLSLPPFTVDFDPNLLIRPIYFCLSLTVLTGSTVFEVLTTTQAHRSKPFILCLYIKSIRVNQAEVHWAYFVQSDQHGIIATPNAKFCFKLRFSMQ